MSAIINPQSIIGTNGDAIISTDTALSPINVQCTATGGSKSISATGAFTHGQMIWIHEDTGSNYGLNEINYVDSYTSGTITTMWNLVNTYANAQVTVFVDYLSLILSGGKLSMPGWDGSKGGAFALAVKGTLDVAVGASIYLSGKQAQTGTPAAQNGVGGGFRGGGGANSSQAAQGESHSSGGSASKTANAESGGGGGSGNGSGGSAISGFDNTLQTFFPFPGAGGGSNSNSGHGRSGGNGGAIGIIIAGRIRLRGTGAIMGRGGDGISNQDAGPGAGSNIRIITSDMKLDTTDCIDLSGGTRTSGASDGDLGGSGANVQAPGNGAVSAADGHVRIETCRLSGTIGATNQSIVAGGFPWCGTVGRIG